MFTPEVSNMIASFIASPYAAYIFYGAGSLCFLIGTIIAMLQIAAKTHGG
jgi:hypothetical protein